VSSLPPFQQRLDQLFERVSGLGGGEVADYIPELGRADPAAFGFSITTALGDHFAVGDSDVEFTIQSVSKPFVYGLALLDAGEQTVLDRVGIEPTGDPFNAVKLAENGRPLNPMVNAGAIVTTTLVDGADAAGRTARIVSGLSAFAGRPLTIDSTVFESEMAHSDRNRAIAHLMRGSGALSGEVEDALTSYVSQCSVSVTTRDLATMCATLANSGINPITGQQVLPPELITHVLTIMATCGMYDAAGTWMYRVGLPAKSGVSGAVVAVLPNEVGLAAWSPPLDEHGNSVRGVRMVELLSDHLDLHVYAPTGPGGSPIRRISSGAILRSRTGRSLADQDLLAEFGDRIKVVELEGSIGLLEAQRVVGVLREMAFDTPSWLVLNLRLVSFLHPGASKLLIYQLEILAAAGVQVTVVTRAAAEGSRSAMSWPLPIAEHLDGALQDCEDALLQDLRAEGAVVSTAGLDQCQILNDLSAEMREAVAAHLTRVQVSQGEVVLEAGAAGDGLLWVLRGELDLEASTHAHSSSTRLRGFGPGGVIGELGLIDGGQPSGRLVARHDSELARLREADLLALEAEHPGLEAALILAVARILVARQRRSFRVIESLEQEG